MPRHSGLERSVAIDGLNGRAMDAVPSLQGMGYAMARWWQDPPTDESNQHDVMFFQGLVDVLGELLSSAQLHYVAWQRSIQIY